MWLSWLKSFGNTFSGATQWLFALSPMDPCTTISYGIGRETLDSFWETNNVPPLASDIRINQCVRGDDIRGTTLHFHFSKQNFVPPWASLIHNTHLSTCNTPSRYTCSHYFPPKKAHSLHYQSYLLNRGLSPNMWKQLNQRIHLFG